MENIVNSMGEKENNDFTDEQITVLKAEVKKLKD